MIRPGKKPTILFEGRIAKNWTIFLLILVNACLVETIYVSHGILGFDFYSILAWFAYFGLVSFCIYVIWLAAHEKLLFEDEQITYVSGRKIVSYQYKDIHTVFILKTSPGGRDPYRSYLVIPIGKTSAAIRKRMRTDFHKAVSLSAVSRMEQFGHLVCVIKNEKEKELIVVFLRNRVNIIWE